jgi:hypothetical protein
VLAPIHRGVINVVLIQRRRIATAQHQRQPQQSCDWVVEQNAGLENHDIGTDAVMKNSAQQ